MQIKSITTYYEELLTTKNSKEILTTRKNKQLIVLARIITMNYFQLKITKIIAND